MAGISRPLVDNGAAHSTRLWTAATRFRRCPPAPHTSFAFGLTRRCASCPNDTHHRSFPRHRYSHRYTLPSTTDRLVSHCRSPVVSGSHLNWKRLWSLWPEFFTEQCVYRLQPRENFERGFPLATLSFESKGM